MKKINKFGKILVISAILGTFNLTGCNNQSEVADTVVYSKIYTANTNQDYVEAFAVKDGKYIFVGSKQDAKKYIKEGTTNVIDYSNDFVMPGATEGHGHYLVSSVLNVLDLSKKVTTIKDLLDFVQTTVSENPNSSLYLTFGWDNIVLSNIKSTINMRAELDKICNDKPMVIIDDTGHNVFMNSKTIELAGINGDTVITGGSFSKDNNGNLLGLATDVAMNYVMNKVVKPSNFLSSSDFEKGIEFGQKTLHENGYTYYLDAYTSYFGEQTFKAISDYDTNKGLKIYLEATNKIDPFEENLSECIQTTVSYKSRYTTTRFNPDAIKLFADGECVESMSGWVLQPYKDGTYGTQIWQDNQMDYLVKTANENGISVHVHTSGDGATTQVVNSMVKADSYKKAGVKNSLGHCFGLTSQTMDLMAKYNIASATNIGWRNYFTTDNIESKFTSVDWFLHGYPLKSQLEKGITLTSSTDYPSNAYGHTDILNIIELAVNGTIDKSIFSNEEQIHIKSFSSDEFLTFNQALDVLTINGAKLLGIDKERGSIEVGKYADFIHIDKDISSIEINTIHQANISDVYFEGKLVFTK